VPPEIKQDYKQIAAPLQPRLQQGEEGCKFAGEIGQIRLEAVECPMLFYGVLYYKSVVPWLYGGGRVIPRRFYMSILRNATIGCKLMKTRRGYGWQKLNKRPVNMLPFK
jgi:hypothetical protein